jgi:hypothetical protein
LVFGALPILIRHPLCFVAEHNARTRKKIDVKTLVHRAFRSELRPQLECVAIERGSIQNLKVGGCNVDTSLEESLLALSLTSDWFDSHNTTLHFTVTNAMGKYDIEQIEQIPLRSLLISSQVRR